jgi:cytochrome c biogenesis protein
MRLAVTLLVVLAVASVIGTVLTQNQQYAAYKQQFGMFWFEVFRHLGLYDVYHAGWFLFLMGFLALSTAICLVRYTPALVREMRGHRVRVTEKSLKTFRWQEEIDLDAGPQEAADRAAGVLQKGGYDARTEAGEEGSVYVGGQRGRLNRLGYVVLHGGIVVILLGGLIDGQVPLQFRELTGMAEPETEFNKPPSQIPSSAKLPPSNPAFRGNVTIPEGRETDVVYLQSGEGYYVQQLDFTVRNEDFRVRHYNTGQPKSFESDLVILEDGEEVARKTVSVNDPLTYKGVSLYQASFSDGGSRLQTQVWDLSSPGGEPREMEGQVHGSRTLGDYEVAFEGFGRHEVVPMPDPDKEGETVREDLGPHMDLQIALPGGSRVEVRSYMAPVRQPDGRDYHVQGLRMAGSQEGYQYLFLPVGPKGSLEPFMRFYGNLSQRASGAAQMSQELLLDAYREATEDLGPEWGPRGEKGHWLLQASLDAMLKLRNYPVPFLITLEDFDQVQAAGIQMTRSPGANYVWGGSILVLLGMMLMFYWPHRKVWAIVKPRDGGSRILLAGTTNRSRLDFELEFTRLRDGVEAAEASGKQ